MFRTDLDAYCVKLMPLLKQLVSPYLSPVYCMHMVFLLIQPDEDGYTAFPKSKLEAQLNTWFSDNVSILKYLLLAYVHSGQIITTCVYL